MAYPVDPGPSELGVVVAETAREVRVGVDRSSLVSGFWVCIRPVLVVRSVGAVAGHHFDADGLGLIGRAIWRESVAQVLTFIGLLGAVDLDLDCSRLGLN